MGSHYKPRHKPSLSSKDMEDICRSYTVDKLSYPEVAKKHRVTPALVGKLIREARKMPEKMRERKQQEKVREQAKDVVGEIVEDMLKKSFPIKKASQIQEKALELHGIEIKN